ncbi:HupE/UreJ family protein [Neobacillus dielmonensis]|uniref:HupE/UreJ family protein n=1 Tax=Neobacillus dielmonensis TaxID=1347369 RepID=UPI0005A88BD0|nr:HupE/UreJ family protein [Neobacillus dielmonensis]
MKESYLWKIYTILIIALLCLPKFSYAHALSAAYTTINITDKQTELYFSIDTLSVIEGAGGDKNEDGTLSKEELKELEFRLQEWVEDGIVLEVDGKQQESKLKKVTLEQKGDQEMVTLQFIYPAFQVGQTVKLLDGIFYEGQNASSYNNFLAVKYGDQVSEAVLHGNNREWAMRLAETQQQQKPGDETAQEAPPSKQTNSSWASFLTLGMEHILTGYDHLLFLLALLIRKQTIKQYIATITAFTIAHSITLTLSVLGIVELPSKFVESIIALSICYVAIENIFRKEIKFRWLITFLFGLIHGLGFASILKEMNLPKSELAIALLNFNVGIELIQLLIVLILVPVLFKLQTIKKYRGFVNYGSAIIFVLGAIWLVQRLFS